MVYIGATYSSAAFGRGGSVRYASPPPGREREVSKKQIVHPRLHANDFFYPGTILFSFFFHGLVTPQHVSLAIPCVEPFNTAVRACSISSCSLLSIRWTLIQPSYPCPLLLFSSSSRNISTKREVVSSNQWSKLFRTFQRNLMRGSQHVEKNTAGVGTQHSVLA